MNAVMILLPLVAIGEPDVDRVKVAKERVGPVLKQLCKSAELDFPPQRLRIRAFKDEKTLEVWGAAKTGPYRLVKTYPIAKASGVLGPKRREGDKQVPEGLYIVDRFNPKSKFHLSLGINYPNSEDRKWADPQRPGGDIFIHGSDQSIGCLAMTDPVIEEIYVLALACRETHRSQIQVHIFPFKFDRQSQKREPPNLDAKRLWKTLKVAYDKHPER